MEGDISRLPEDAIRLILSRLEVKEAIRISIFCKTWYMAWLTRPTLNFSISKGKQGKRVKRDLTEKYFKFIKTTLQRYQEQHICMKKLVLGLATDSYLASIVDELIVIIVQIDVERLQLDFHPFRVSTCDYTMSSTIFEAKTLKELIIRGPNVKLEKRVGEKVMFTRLQKLHLVKIHIKDDIFEGIISSCPLIDNLSIQDCLGLNRIKVTDLHNLKQLTVCVWNDQSFEIDAPGLRYLDFRIDSRSTLPLAAFFDNLGHKFPELEDLRLAVCNGLQRIDISSTSLKRIMLSAMRELMEVHIDAPSMISFEFLNIIFFPDLFLINASSQWVSKISISINFYLSRLEAILAQLIQSKISLALRSTCYIDNYFPIYPAVEVEELNLDFNFRISPINGYDSLFRTCRPKVVTRQRGSYLYEDLIEK